MPSFRQFPGQRIVGGAPERLDVARTIDSGGADLACDSDDDFGGRAATQHERRTQPPQFNGKRGQTAVQPPAAGAAHPPRPGRDVVEHIERRHRPAGVGRRRERRLVVDTQVLAKPDDDRRVRHFPILSRPAPENTQLARSRIANVHYSTEKVATDWAHNCEFAGDGNARNVRASRASPTPGGGVPTCRPGRAEHRHRRWNRPRSAR